MLGIIETVSILAVPALVITYFRQLWMAFWENPEEILVNATRAILLAAKRDLVLPMIKVIVLVVNIVKDLVLKGKEILGLVVYIGGQALQSVENVLKLIAGILKGFNHIFITTNTIDRIVPLEYIWFILFMSCLTFVITVTLHKIKKLIKED